MQNVFLYKKIGLKERGGSVNEELRQFVLRQNIARYRRLLETPLMDHERAFIERRIAEDARCLQPSQSETVFNLSRTLKSITILLSAKFSEFFLPMLNAAEWINSV